MRLSADGREYIVHLNYDRDLLFGGEPLIGVRAMVHEGPCERANEQARCTKFASFGWSACHPNDQFVRATGRKIALGRALRALIEDKALRARLWADYRTKAS